MKHKLSTGREIKIKDISLDERDEMLDSVQYEIKEDGSVGQIKMMHSTMTKWIRIGVDGDTSDKYIKSLTLEERIEIFTKMQEEYLVGEEKASK